MPFSPIELNVVGHRDPPTPMGPGDKPRDDNGVYIARAGARLAGMTV
jgi:hypothetical protein